MVISCIPCNVFIWMMLYIIMKRQFALFCIIYVIMVYILLHSEALGSLFILYIILLWKIHVSITLCRYRIRICNVLNEIRIHTGISPSEYLRVIVPRKLYSPYYQTILLYNCVIFFGSTSMEYG